MSRAAVLAALLFSLAACAESNPIEWGKSAARDVGNMFSSGTPPEAEPPAAEGRPYPNLATVPRRPRDPPEARAQREADLERLTRDREKALTDDRVLRNTGAMPPPSEPEVPKEVAGAPAPAVPPAAAVPPPAVAAVPPPSSPAPSAAPSPATIPTTTPAAAPALVSVQRVGAVGFGRDAATLTPIAQRNLAEAAALARTGNGRVRLVAAQTARQAASPELLRARINTITQALAAAGIPATRVTIEEALGRRIDLYDVYVER